MDAGLLLETLPAVPNQPRLTAAKQMSNRKWRKLLVRYIFGLQKRNDLPATGDMGVNDRYHRPKRKIIQKVIEATGGNSKE